MRQAGTRREMPWEASGVASTALNWQKMETPPPKGAGMPSLRLLPTFCSRLPEAGAGVQFAGCNIVRGR